MDEKFWDAIAGSYESEIFDTLVNDRNGTILKYINRFGSHETTACDFGCGIGKYLPILAKRFKTVYAIDISGECLKRAQESSSHLDNVVYFKSDLSNPDLKISKVSFAISINMLIMPSVKRRLRILRNLFRSIRKGGYLLLVVPSLESVLYSHFRLLEWNLKTGLRHRSLIPQRLMDNNSSKTSIRTGDLDLDGAQTKHYLKEELVDILSKAGFRIASIDKVEYPWKTEFANPPRWMREPYPWDWLIVCRKS